ncbi:permease-like cell division protein FtsX [Actinophytocola oryzae]|uniref:FtsX extracellular domain-containing protein n=1 Tax=Actinophytocola oryzae TaxID=502181 RepID=A0A4R7VWU9_9PSEU|nr:permease-like cell division protein FtsX [Actinophytocola oryzae]TDV54125.1 hypothetical protein CLV71_104594 [Actinophytocola oryzae]
MTRRVGLVLWAAVGVVVAAFAAVTVLAVVTYDGPGTASRPLVPEVPRSSVCLNKVILYFETDDEMRDAAARLRTHPQVESLIMETKAEAYERFKKIFADQPELVELARPEALPASVTIRPTPGTDADRLSKRLAADFGRLDDDAMALPCRPK